MKKPNYGQQQKMKTLDPVALANYCKEKDLEMPQTSVPVAQIVSHPQEPKTEQEVVLTPVSDHDIEAPVTSPESTSVTLQNPTITTSVTVNPPVEANPQVSDAQLQLTVAANRFFDLRDRLIQNAAHSVLNWDEMADLEALLQPHRRKEAEIHVTPPTVSLPEGQKWAIVVGEPMNRTQKFIRFQEESRDTPYKMLYVQYSQQRYMGRKVRVKTNPDETVGGYVLA